MRIILMVLLRGMGNMGSLKDRGVSARRESHFRGETSFDRPNPRILVL